MTTVAGQLRLQGADRIVIALGWGLVVTSVADFIMGFALASQENPGARWYPEMIGVNVAQHLLMLGGVYAVMRSAAGGHGRLAGGGFAIALAGIAILCVAEPITLISLNTAYAFFGLAMLAMAAGLTMAGISVARAVRWQGGSRFSLLSTGLFIPFVMVPAMFVPGLWFHYAIGLWGLTFLWVAATLLRTERQ